MSKHLPKCRACGNEPKEPAEIEYSLGVVPYETTRITVVRCWRCGRFAMTPEAQAVIEGARNDQTKVVAGGLFEGVKV